jgi:hypothetical protein
MPALLALIPGKDWLYGGIIVALLAGFGWFTVHERHAGAAHEVAALKASSDKLQAQTAVQTAELKAKATMAEQAYDKEVHSLDALPTPIVRLCINSGSHPIVPAGGGAKSGNASAGTSAAGIQQVPSGNSSVAGPDIGGMLTAFADRADEVSATLREFQSR